MESPAQFGRLRTLIHPGLISGVHVKSIGNKDLWPYGVEVREKIHQRMNPIYLFLSGLYNLPVALQ